MILQTFTPGAHLPPPWGKRHMYYHNIQTSFSLKALGQSKPTFIRSIFRQGGNQCAFIKKNPGHMTRMAAMPIYGKTLQNLFSRTGGPISTKLLKYYHSYINHDLVMTLTYFTARFELRKLLKCHLKERSCRK